MRTLRLITAVSFLCAGAAAAQPAHLVEDIVTSTRSGGLGAGALFAFGSDVYFGASGPGSAEQLWKTDGTPQGTRKLRDFDVIGGTAPYGFTATDSGFFFFLDDELWRVDASGEPRRVREFPGVAWGGGVAALGDAILFALDDGVHGAELWRSDGTAEGTALVTELEPGPDGSDPRGLARLDDAVYFFVRARSGNSELWRTDGSEAGTIRLLDLGPVYFDYQTSPMAFGNLLAFVTVKGTESAAPYWLWRSDGTAAGTFPLAAFVGDSPGACPGFCFPYGPSGLTAVGDRLFLVGNDGDHGRELWKTDGTVSGTTLVRDVSPGPDAGLSYGLIAAGQRVYFSGQDAEHGFELWSSDGTAEGTSLVADLLAGPESSYSFPFCALGDRALFSGQDSGDIWVTDGTAAGTMPVHDLDALQVSLYGFAEIPDGVLYLQSVLFGSVLWRTDGTQAGTSVVDPFEAAEGSQPSLMTDVAGRLMFSPAVQPYAEYPTRELWSSDGTDDGTAPVAAFDAFGPGPWWGGTTAAFAGSLYFSAKDVEHGIEIWKSDGTPQGTALLKDLAIPTSEFPGWSDSYPSAMTVVDDSLFFVASTPGRGAELWRTDGSIEGTRLVRDIRAGASGSEPAGLVALAGRLYFMANDGVSGKELWVSDGTESGTSLVFDIHPGPEGCVVQGIAVALGRIFLGAYDGFRFGLWSSDGTPSGTFSLGPFDPHQLTAGGNLLYFTDYHYSKLWRSDGTTDGTYVLREIRASQLTGSTGPLYFIGHDAELWRSDGTETGTRRLRDIRAGAAWPWSISWSLTAVDNLAVFSANDGEHGVELWSSDGTEAGTTMIQDIAVGSSSSTPSKFTRSGDLVYFSADDGRTGVELWAIPAAALRPEHPREVEPATRPTTPTRSLPPRP